MASPRVSDRRGRTGRRGGRFALTTGLALLLCAPHAAAESPADAPGPRLTRPTFAPEPPDASTLRSDRLPPCPPDPRILEALRVSGAPDPSRVLVLVPVSPQLFPVYGVYDRPSWIVLPGCSISLEHARDGIFGGPTGIPRLRALLGITAFFGLEVANYWIGRDLNAPDWELSWTWPSWEKKLVSGEGLSLDTNRFETNAVWHPIAGAVYYLAGRGNGLGVTESFALSFFASAAWEYVAEFREKVSINDLVVTPVAGVALGEPLHRLSVFFAEGRGPVAGTLAVVTSPFRALSDWIEEGSAERTRRLDALGLPADTWHRFDLFVGAAAIAPRDRLRLAETQLGVSAELLDIPEYERPTAVERPVPPGTATRISVQASLAGGDLARFDFASRTSLGGYFWQKLRPARGGLTGYNLSVGAATGFGYAVQDWEGGWTDKLGVANVLGLTADVGLYHRGLRFRAGVGVSGDFSSVSSAAISDFLLLNGSDGIRSVLRDRKYYFALGTTIRPGISVGYRGFEVGGDTQYQAFESIEGLDRFQRQVTRDIDVHDYRLLHRAWLSYTVPGDRLKLTWLSLEHRDRSGRAGMVRAERAETRALVGVSLLF